MRGLSDHYFEIPPADELITDPNSDLTQLLSYYVGTAKGIDVDKPRNLAKSVTTNKISANNFLNKVMGIMFVCQLSLLTEG